jgi:hypothetical protein
MSGIARQDPMVPSGTVTVRLIRGQLSNRVTEHPVELFVGETPRTARTDAEGRAEFDKLPVGAALRAVATIDGERLESQTFEVPATGPGIRLMLVATDKEAEARKAAEASAPAISAPVVLGGDTRIVIEPGDENVDVYYILEILNNARAPANPAVPFEFDLPDGAGGTTLFEGSTPLAVVTGTHVRVNGPFPPGKTALQVAARFPVRSGSLEMTQRFPATVERLLVLVRKLGNTRVTSPQIQNQREFPSGEDVIIASLGGTIAPNQPISLQLSDMPHHSQVPRLTALGIASLVVVVGVVAARRPATPERRDDRKKLEARREKLFQDLVRLEEEARNGRGDGSRYASRREELVTALERVYGALDSGETGPGPGDRTGLAA